jgi:methylthioribose-1-phosphate isomerase
MSSSYLGGSLARSKKMTVPTLSWIGGSDGHLRLIDQTLLPTEFREIDCRDVESVWEAIRSLRVRGAPAIGIAAAYGLCLGLQSQRDANEAKFFAKVDRIADYLMSSRPTAVNLAWAVERLKGVAQLQRGLLTVPALFDRLLTEARTVHEEDRQMCRAIGRLGAELLADGQGVLTHCNAGGLATSEYGTALAVFFAAHESGKRLHVYADETRPLLQGARLTAWELGQRGIATTLICDSMAAQVMREGRVQAVVVGADRIAANGDTANKIGTYSVAILAKEHDIPFYVAAPLSTIDRTLSDGSLIPIEERSPAEVTHCGGHPIAPAGVTVRNPAFDVTPARYISAIITERGVATADYQASLAGLFAR